MAFFLTIVIIIYQFVREPEASLGQYCFNSLVSKKSHYTVRHFKIKRWPLILNCHFSQNSSSPNIHQTRCFYLTKHDMQRYLMQFPSCIAIQAGLLVRWIGFLCHVHVCLTNQNKGENTPGCKRKCVKTPLDIISNTFVRKVINNVYIAFLNIIFEDQKTTTKLKRSYHEFTRKSNY